MASHRRILVSSCIISLSSLFYYVTKELYYVTSRLILTVVDLGRVVLHSLFCIAFYYCDIVSLLLVCRLCISHFTQALNFLKGGTCHTCDILLLLLSCLFVLCIYICACHSVQLWACRDWWGIAAAGRISSAAVGCPAFGRQVSNPSSEKSRASSLGLGHVVTRVLT
jgi:hypothetical protein